MSKSIVKNEIMVIAALMIESVLILAFLGALIFLKWKHSGIGKDHARLIAIASSAYWSIGAALLPLMTVLLFIGKDAPARLLMKGVVFGISGFLVVLSLALSVFSVSAVWINYRAGKYDLVFRRAVLPFFGFIPLFISLALIFASK